MSKIRKCRMEPGQLEIHEEAVKLRKMTDEQLVMAFRAARVAPAAVSDGEPKKDTDGVRKLLEGLYRGDCKGIKSANAYKIEEYAAEMGLL